MGAGRLTASGQHPQSHEPTLYPSGLVGGDRQRVLMPEACVEGQMRSNAEPWTCPSTSGVTHLTAAPRGRISSVPPRPCAPRGSNIGKMCIACGQPPVISRGMCIEHATTGLDQLALARGLEGSVEASK